MEVLDFKTVKQQFEQKCKHKDAYHDESIQFKWGQCKDCDLCKTPWNLPDFSLGETKNSTTQKDVCFAIWHEDYLNDVIKHIQSHDELFPRTVLIHEGVAYISLYEARELLRGRIW